MKRARGKNRGTWPESAVGELGERALTLCLLRNLGALRARLRQSDRDRLLAARHFLAASRTKDDVASAFLALALPVDAGAQMPPHTAKTANPASSVSAADREFVETAGEAGLAEVGMAEAAQKRGSSADVKSFAGRMMAGHGKAKEQLKSIATTKGIEVPDKLSAKDPRELAKLQKLDAAKFDMEYAAAQVAAHKDAVNLSRRNPLALRMLI